MAMAHIYDSTFLITSLEIHAFLNKITAQGWLYGSVRYGCYIYCGLDCVGVFICSGDSVVPKRLKKSLKVGGSSCPIYIYIYIVSGSLIECIIIKLFDPIKIINWSCHEVHLYQLFSMFLVKHEKEKEKKGFHFVFLRWLDSNQVHWIICIWSNY